MDLKYFAYEHLPTHLQVVSEPFGLLARKIASSIPDCEQKEVCLQKLLEAKDACVRAALPAEGAGGQRPMSGEEMMRAGYRRIDPDSIPNADGSPGRPLGGATKKD